MNMPFSLEEFKKPNLAGLRELNSATECVRSFKPFPIIEFGLAASAIDEATARKELPNALKSSDFVPLKLGFTERKSCL